MSYKTFRDAVHGDIHFSREEVRIIDTAPVQRLRGIKQLGSSNLVYPSAVHTRFEHSLGTCWVAKRMLSCIEEHYGMRIPEEELQLVSIASLLHDITHIPFGHTFEDERLVFPRHDEDQSRLRFFLEDPALATELKALGLRDEVERLLLVKDHFSEQKPYISQIVSHTICADLLDYLKRDAYFCGLVHAYDDRIFRYFRIIDDCLAFDLQKGGLIRPDAISEITHLLRLRYLLTERVYFHHAKIASGVMISKAVEMCVSRGLKLRDLYWLRDDSLLYALRVSFGAHGPLVELLNKIERRFLLCRGYVLTPRIGETHQRKFVSLYHQNDEGTREDAEVQIAKAVGVPGHAITIYCPKLGVSLKEARVRVLIDSGMPRSLETLGNREIDALSQKYRDLWRFYVFLDRDYMSKIRELGETCTEFFGLPNEVPLNH